MELKVRCHRCKHEWEYKPRVRTEILNLEFKRPNYSVYIICPKCHTTVMIYKKVRNKQ